MSAGFKQYSATATLAAGVAQNIDVPIDAATNWVVVVRNTGGANAVTAATVAASPLGTTFEASVAIASGIPLAAGASLAGIRGIGEPIAKLRITLTSTAGTTVLVEGGGL